MQPLSFLIAVLTSFTTQSHKKLLVSTSGFLLLEGVGENPPGSIDERVRERRNHPAFPSEESDIASAISPPPDPMKSQQKCCDFVIFLDYPTWESNWYSLGHMENKEEMQEVLDDSLQKIVQKITHRHLGDVTSIERLRTGICNEVFAVRIDDAEFIVRLNKKVAEMRGSSLFIPKLTTLGIIVPRIIAEEYDVSKTGFGYQILERLPGTDLGNVIETLSDEQLKEIAVSVADIFQKLRTLPTDNSYGLVMDEHGGKFSNWKEWVDDDLQTAEVRGKETGFIHQVVHLTEPVLSIIRRYDDYFRSVPSIAYYGDIAGKNVLVDNGAFSGLVDLDALAYGDWLEAVGRIRASWYGTSYGETYTNAVMDALNLTDEQRAVVRMYTLHHRYVWMCENGVKFNENTTGVIDQEKAERDMAVVERLIRECSHR